MFLALGYGSMGCMLPVSRAVCMDIGFMDMAGQLDSFLTAFGLRHVAAAALGYNNW